MRARQLRWSAAAGHLSAIQSIYAPFFQYPLQLDTNKMCQALVEFLDNLNPLGAGFPDLAQMRKAELAGTVGTLADELQSLPWQEPRAYMILRSLQDGIEMLLRHQDMPDSISIPSVVVVGTIPRGHVNATVIGTEDPDAAIIAFEYGLIKFFSHLCCVLGRLITAPGVNEKLRRGLREEEATEIVLNDKESTSQFVWLMHHYLTVGGVFTSASPSTTNEWYASAMRLRLSTEYFCLGHEYGHLIKGHLAAGRKTLPLGQGTHCEEIETNYAEEHDADTWGMTLSIKMMNMLEFGDIVESYAGTELFFGTDDLVHRSIMLLSGQHPQKWSSPTHPPAYERRQYMRERLALICPLAEVTKALTFANSINELLCALSRAWERIIDGLSPDAIVLAPQWRMQNPEPTEPHKKSVSG